MLITKPFLAPIRICDPEDPAIDLEAWGSKKESYLDEVSEGLDPALPPVKPGEKLTVFTLAPLKYTAFQAVSHMISHKPEGWLVDPEIQRFILRHSLTEVENACKDVNGDLIQVRLRSTEGPHGKCLTSEAWDEVAPFLDGGLLLLQVTLAVLYFSRPLPTATAR